MACVARRNLSMSWSITLKAPVRAGLVLASLVFGFLSDGRCLAAPESEPAPRAVEAMNRGFGFMGQYQYSPAVQAFQEALQAEPELSAAKINLAIARFNRNRKEDQDVETAQKLLNEVLQKEPDNGRALYFKGIVLQHMGQTEEAVHCFEKVVQRMPGDGVAWYLLGMCKQRLGQSGEPELLRAVQCRPFLFSAYYRLSQIAMREGQEEKARHYLEQFNKLRESPLGEAIELPQYNQMGELALAQPLNARGRRQVTASHFELGPAQTVFEQAEPLGGGLRGSPDAVSQPGAATFGGAAAGDVNGDGRVDLILTTGSKDRPGQLTLLLGAAAGGFREATTGSGLEPVTNALSCAFGDYDNDGKTDLFVACAGENHLFKGNGDGTFADVTRQTGTGGGLAVSRFAMFLDADHDGDLDILVCNAGKVNGGGPAANQLLRNNGDGTFTDIAKEAGIACDDSFCVYAQTGDIDNDRAMDLVMFREGQPARIFLNDLLGKYHETKQPGLDIYGDRGAVLQDFNGDGQLDILALGGKGPTLRLFVGDGHGHFKPSETFEDVAKAAASWGPLLGMRVADIDLDGDLDIALFSSEAHLLLNDGWGRFVLQPLSRSTNKSSRLVGAELMDLTGDNVPDLLRIERGLTHRLSLAAGELSPPQTSFAIRPSGVRSRDGRTRSPANGYGVKIAARTGLWEQVVTRTGLWGGANQSELPMAFGLNGAVKADYIDLLWPDGVRQVEIGLAGGQAPTITETQRKISSCPVLFAWNGQRFEFVTDFAGVGGLGYFSAPGVSAPPQVLEHVKIEPNQLRPKDGFYELRVTEPMEETAYIDQLELLAIDHPTNQQVFPDERLAINGPPPTHELLVVEKLIFPVEAIRKVVTPRPLTPVLSPLGGYLFNGVGLLEAMPVAKRLECARFIAAFVLIHTNSVRYQVGCDTSVDSGDESPHSKRWRAIVSPTPKQAPNADDGREDARLVAPKPSEGGRPGEGQTDGGHSVFEADCTENLRRVDRVYAYEPPLDRRYIGFCRSHTLELDFGDRLSVLGPQDKVFLFIHGFIEYPYSQTTYAASQSRVGWEPIRIDHLGKEGQWQTIVPDGGAPGGMARLMTIDLSGKLDASTRKLRLTTNLEIYYDQIFLARHSGLAQVKVQSVPLADAELRRVGFAREHSPDGQLPLIYDYDRMDATAPFHMLRGAYTRYGRVNELLEAFDDKYVLVGPGDEIALRFDGSKLAEPSAGMTRSFVLVSHAYCKDMDLYTATPQTVEPLPFRAMTRYPYPSTEHYPDDEEHQAFLKAYNTRIIE